MVIAVCDCDNEILLLKRRPEKFKGDLYDVPGGKIKKNEDFFAAMKREILEETGLKVEPKDLNYLSEVYVRYTEFDFTNQIFWIKFADKPEIKISLSEHTKYKWAKINELEKINFVPDELERIKIYLNKKG